MRIIWNARECDERTKTERKIIILYGEMKAGGEISSSLRFRLIFLHLFRCDEYESFFSFRLAARIFFHPSSQTHSMALRLFPSHSPSVCDYCAYSNIFVCMSISLLSVRSGAHPSRRLACLIFSVSSRLLPPSMDDLLFEMAHTLTFQVLIIAPPHKPHTDRRRAYIFAVLSFNPKMRFENDIHHGGRRMQALFSK